MPLTRVYGKTTYDHIVEAGLELIGRAVRTRRHRMGLTQRELAALAGVSQSTICRLENANLSGLRLQRLASIVATLNGFPVAAEEHMHYPTRAGAILLKLRLRSEPAPLPTNPRRPYPPRRRPPSTDPPPDPTPALDPTPAAEIR